MQNIKKYYKTAQVFDAYLCDVGRVTVGAGAEYIIEEFSDRVYFINSQNYLPSSARDPFLKTPRITIHSTPSEPKTIKFVIYIDDIVYGYSRGKIHEYVITKIELNKKFTMYTAYNKTHQHEISFEERNMYSLGIFKTLEEAKLDYPDAEIES